MNSRRWLGIHSQRYCDQSYDQHQHRRLVDDDVTRLDKKYQDIACLDDPTTVEGNRISLSCIVGHEDLRHGIDPERVESRYRRWGTYQADPALVLPMRIYTTSDGEISIRRYEIEVSFDGKTNDAGNKTPQCAARQYMSAETKVGDGAAASAPFFASMYNNLFGLNTWPLPGVDSTPRPQMSLLEVPQPQKIEKQYSDQSWWKFCSRSITDTSTGQSRTASMTWSAVNHPPETLYCILAVAHQNRNIGLTCRVSGEAYIGRYPYSFNNQEHGRNWELRPQSTNYDLQPCIDTLEAQALEMNRRVIGTEPPRMSDTQVVVNGHYFAAIHAQGGGHFHMGDHHAADTRPQLDPQHNSSTLYAMKEDFS